jgi:phosphoglycolate phosphatase
MTAPRPLELIVLDFDGTLADSFPWFISVLNDVARRWRFREVDPAEHATLRRLGALEVFASLGVPGWKVPLIAHDLRRRMGREIHQIRPFAGVDALLSSLQTAGLRLALATSNSLGNVRTVLGAANLARFERLECGIAITAKPGRLKRVLRCCRVGADRAIYIGDEIRDIAAARAAGMAAGAVGWGYNALDVLRAAAPDRLFPTLTDLARLADEVIA